jgi:hypothetical protein
MAELTTQYFSQSSQSVVSCIKYLPMQHAQTPLKLKYFVPNLTVCEVHRIPKNAVLHSEFEA